MPKYRYKQHEKYKKQIFDGRVKILKKQYPEVITMYKDLKSSRKVAKIFGVDKKIILFIVNPEYKKRDALRQKNEQHWKIYYNKDKHKEAIAKYRKKKKLLGYKYKKVI